MQQIFLGNLRAETGEGAKDLKPAAHHDEECDGVNPVAEADDVGMLVGGASDDDGNFFLVSFLRLDDFDD